MHTDTFDRLSRLLGSSGTRRSAFRALLGMAILGTTPASVTAQIARDRPTGPYGPIGLPGQNCAGACIHICGSVIVANPPPGCLSDCLDSCVDEGLLALIRIPRMDGMMGRGGRSR